ncbi:DUF1731 domain-containing protein [Rathayibacter oskolensis]|uniref:DUF1731 domain-containing protein n=1 Tax=Rathayibacter oskolensis TaxID=1891671 RepID=UPI003465748D
MRTLAEQLHRPFKLAVPEKIIELALRDAGHELLLSSQQLVPQRLIDDGFTFRHGTVAEALGWVLNWAGASCSRAIERRIAPRARLRSPLAS